LMWMLSLERFHIAVVVAENLGNHVKLVNYVANQKYRIRTQ
jgi:hypothetical protein